MKDQNLPVEYPIAHEEKKEIKRLTFKNGIAYIFDAFNLQNGGLYTLKWLILNPGRTIKNYIGEQRYLITSPWKLLLLTTAFSLFLLLQFDFMNEFIKDFGSGMKSAGNETTNIEYKLFTFFNDYYNFILWSSIPVFATVFFIALKRGFNYFEHVVLYTYYLVLSNIVFILLMPAFAYTDYGFEAYFLISHIYLVYTYKNALSLNKWHHYIRLIIGLLISYFLYFIVLILMMMPFVYSAQ